MVSTLFGKKVGMTQIFDDHGDSVPVTIIEVEDLLVVDKKSEERDGYNAIKIGFGDVKKPKNVTKAVKGIFKNEKTKKDLPFKKNLREIRVSKEDLGKFEVGAPITIEELKDAKFVDVTGISKGKGFQGTMKRWNFSGGASSHGSMSHRAPGSIGSSTFPARVFKNQKMGGHMGNVKTTVQNLKVEKVDTENKFILVNGAVPGANNGLLAIKKSVKKKQ